MPLTRPTAAQINTVVTTISDPITVLNQGSTAANIDVGFIINRNGGLLANVAVFWNESANTFALAFTTNSGELPNANIAISTYANLRVNTLNTTFLNATGNILTAQLNAGQINTTGNVLATTFVGSGALLTALPGYAHSNVNVKAYTESMGFTNYSNVNVAAYLAGNITVGNIIVPTGAGRFNGPFNESTTIQGVYVGNLNLSPRIGFFNGTAAQNWQIDNNFGSFRWYTPGVVRMSIDTGGNLNVPSGNIMTAGNVTAPYFIGSGQFLTGLPASYSNVNVAAYTQTQSYTNYSNVNLSAYLGGAVTVGGNLTVQGNLIIQGTTTTVNSTTLDVTDLNITVAKGAASAAAANGAGLTVDGAGATLLYTSSTDSWNINKTFISNSFVNTSGNISAAVVNAGAVNVSGNILSTGLSVFGNTRIGSLAVPGALHTIIGNVDVSGAGTEYFNIGGNILAIQGSFGSINSTGLINTTANISAAILNSGAINSTGLINTTANISAAILNSGAINSTGLINTTANISAAQINSATAVVTGSAFFGELYATTRAGDEGGQLNLANAVTNTTLVGNIVIDVFQNRLRIFESGGTNRGGYFDLSGLSASAGTNLAGGGGGTPGGGNGQLQFNSSSAFAGAASLYYFGANGAIVANAGIASTSTTTGTMQITGGIGVSGNLYVGQRVGYVWGANNVSSVYQVFNNTTNSLDTVFG
jgi:hypothetical protein